MKRLAVLLLFALAVPACAEPKSFLVHRPDDASIDSAVTEMWAQEIHRVARDGDWILTRSYYALADAISLATPGVDLSHASIYDAKHDTVIEAVGSGVREIPLSELLQRNHYAIVVRPGGMTAAEQERALDRARSRLGAEFDMAGMFGFDNPDKVYCSELVWWASQTELRTGIHERVITPVELMDYGSVIYWSGKRTDEQVMKLAAARAAEHRSSGRLAAN